ncbi:unnamed protein product [Prorocentrum cordatum]|uniref:Uncharacterized protein n=1 Tax=Prorocentrum cordatum TaxID=2364126 RepID=A0ABN9XDU7_9DINO|nr:unnamed protein product [Polarella glacialis]
MALPMKTAMKSGMKAAMKTSMKAAMKKKSISIIAKGVQAKSQVLKGAKVKTSGGLTKDSLMKNKRGKVVSKKKHAAGKKLFASVKKWAECVAKARAALGLKGFVAVNGKKPEGKALYAKAKALYAQA